MKQLLINSYHYVSLEKIVYALALKIYYENMFQQLPARAFQNNIVYFLSNIVFFYNSNKKAFIKT